jgi:hypothetical protein
MIHKTVGLHLMDSPDDFLHVMQCYVAVQAIGPSSLRNQGSPGVIGTARKFLSGLDLSNFAPAGERGFLTQLDKETSRLLQEMPRKARHWGAARKAVNLFLRDALCNRYLAEKFNLQKTEAWMEIPLDSAVARGLKELSDSAALPIWPGLKKLSPETSAKFQSFAEYAAKKRGLARVHLDMYLWLQER